jgi:hypothetical protein
VAKLKPEKPNITIKAISNFNVATMIETHSKVNTTTIEVDNQMVVIQVGKKTIEDVMLDGGTNVNIIIENLKTKLGLPKQRPTPYHLKMEDQIITRPLGIKTI